MTFSEVKEMMHWPISVPFQVGSTEIIVTPLEKTSEERLKVEAFFYLTMPSSLSVVSVEKICSPILRENWEHELKMVKRKNGLSESDGNIAITKLLWNGTGSTPPSAIYSNEKGWMVNYSTDDNLWGKGAYFSEDVSYVCGRKPNGSFSYKYAHRTKKGTIKLFLAEVIVGDSVQLDETPNLPEPPMKEGTNRKYDSVTGFRHGTFIYCIKDNGRAYPTYVIEFKP
uniref:Poly [ADP-ribose] polymerase n=1 Tax=Arcella intermedia TaxID=1963864 RepID=A0A6B2LCC1_9EUKA